MRTPRDNAIRHALGICAAAAVLAGCGGIASAISPVVTPQRAARVVGGWLSPAARDGHPVIYVADNKQVMVFPVSARGKNPAAIGNITAGVAGAVGLCVDRHGSLYVVNGATNTVTVYPRGSLSPSVTYTGLSSPQYAVVDHDGDLYVSNFNQTVAVFLPGHTSPHRLLHVEGTADGIALDRAGNLYVAFRIGYNLGGIDEFAHGSTRGQRLGIPLVQPQGLLVTDDGTIIAVQTGYADGVYVYPKITSNAAYDKGIRFEIPQTPVQLAISQKGHKLFVSAFGWTGQGHVYAADYPFQRSAPAIHAFYGRIGFYHRGPHRRFDIQGVALSDGQTF